MTQHKIVDSLKSTLRVFPIDRDPDIRPIVDMASTIGIALIVITVPIAAALNPANWTTASWIGSSTAGDASVASDFFRSPSFTTPEETAQAVLHIATLGMGFSRINGQEVSLDELTHSGWTDNESRNLFTSYDVTLALNDPGAENVIAIAVGTGWRSLDDFPRRDYDPIGALAPVDTTHARVVRAQLQFLGVDGLEVALPVNSGDDWLTTVAPFTQTSIYDGEVYDASLEVTGWDISECNLEAWSPAVALASNDAPQGTMISSTYEAFLPPMRISRVVRPVSVNRVVTDDAKVVFVVDFGANLAGVAEVRVPNGCRNLTLVHGEILGHAMLPAPSYPDRPYTGNLRGANAVDTFLAADGVDGFKSPVGNTPFFYRPRMTYHGFRFMEIHGWPEIEAGGAPSFDDVALLHFHSAVDPRTSVAFPSNPVLGAVMTMAQGAQRNNMHSVLTDCPQRDERLGWTGDLSLSSSSFALNFHAEDFGPHLLASLAASQAADGSSDGSVPDTVPFVRWGNRPGDVSWSSALPSLVSALLEQYGDVVTAATYFDAMVNQQRNVTMANLGKLNEGWQEYGDWCPPPRASADGDFQCGGADTFRPTEGFTSAFSYVRMTQQLSSVAAALGRADASTWAEEASDLVAAFIEAWGDPAEPESCDQNLMTNLVLSIALGATSDATGAAESLLSSLNATNYHLSTGIIGARFVFDILLDGVGMIGSDGPDAALAVLERVDFPSYGYMAFNDLEPATENTWELWDAPCQVGVLRSGSWRLNSDIPRLLKEVWNARA